MNIKYFKVRNAIAAFGLVVMLGACSKDFLNDPKPATSISATDVYASPEGVRAYFNGLYRELRTQWGSATEGEPRQSLSAVYDQILSDLNFAIEYIPKTRANDLKDVINYSVAQGILARVYLEMGTSSNNAEYLNKAVAAATAARDGFPLSNTIHATAITTDFASKSEVIWGFPQAADQTIYYGTPSAFFGTSGVGYFNFFVDSNFVNTFSDTDMRRAMFVNPAGSSFVGLRKWKTNKFKTTTDFVDFIPVMRTPEMILIEAEAKARMGAADAATILYDFQKQRDPNAVQSGNTGEDLIDEILFEKRKELFGEIGIGFLDVKRIGKPLVRSDGHIASNAFTIPGNSPRFTLKIPQKEFDSNPQITEADQNP